MARDRLFFKGHGRLNVHRVAGGGTGAAMRVGVAAGAAPGPSCATQPARRLLDPSTHAELYGNLYSNLLDYVVFAHAGVITCSPSSDFCSAPETAEELEPAVSRVWLPGVAGALHPGRPSVVMVVLLFYKTQTTWPGLLIVLAGVRFIFFGSRGRWLKVEC